MGCAAVGVSATIFAALLTMSPHPSGSFRDQLIDGVSYADSLQRALSLRPTESIRAGDAVSMLYLERHRLGVGSPFRLIEQELRDPRIDASERQRLAFGLLERTREGKGYETDAHALDLMTVVDFPLIDELSSGSSGKSHLALIESIVGSTRDPRIGELTVRLAYRLAVASGALQPRAAELAVSAASQARDRILASRDGERLLAAAARSGSEPLELLREWRDRRLFAVERPVIDPLSPDAERVAVQSLPAAVSRIEKLSGFTDEGGIAEPSADASPDLTSDAIPTQPLFPDVNVRRLADVAEARNAPPQAPVTVTLSGYTPLLQRGSANPVDRVIRQRFAALSRNEETLVAEYALLRSRLVFPIPEAAAAVLTASVALRTYSQERAWSSDDAVGTGHVRDAQSRYGVEVTFDRQVPAEWRAYLLRALASALDDFQSVFPGYDPNGLHVRFGESPLHERALALHDPVTRTIYFPAASSAGVMAHELAHDLDWQAARRYYGSVVGYRTDRAVRQVTDQLASALRQMAGALRPDTIRGNTDPQSRPTEIFARNVDWFVSAALARVGRVNGYLSAVQDPVLVGYGSAMSPEVAGDNSSATLRALDGMTAVPQELRAWFSALYGPERKVSVHEAVRRVLLTPLSAADLRVPSLDAFSASEATAALLRRAPAASTAWACLLDAYVEGTADALGARAIMQYAAEARARGVLRRWHALARRYLPPNLMPLRALDGAPWDPSVAEAMVRDVRDAILWRTVDGVGRGSPSVSRFPARVGVLDACGATR